jgi:Uncharacterised nucleotidyltransferase
MNRDYSDPPSRLRALAALVDGCPVDPPPSDQRDRLLALAREHRVEQLAAWQITKQHGDLSLWFGEAGEALQLEARSAAMVDAIRQRELREVLSRISRVGDARPLLFKGAALGYTHYPTSWLRPRLDTDVLISPSSTEEVFKALSEGGYIRVNSTSGTLVMSQASFVRTDTFDVSHAFDVHWRIANWHLIARVASHAELAARAVALPLLGSGARAVSDVDALLLACLHRAAHHRDSQELLWIYDIHLLVERFTSEDWALLLTMATRGQVKALCYRGLALAADLFNTSIPDHVVEDLAAAKRERSAIYLSKDIRLVDGLLSDLRTMPLREAIRLLVEHIWPPAEYMRQKYGVTSRRSLLACYARRLATGVPRWLSPGGWS